MAVRTTDEILETIKTRVGDSTEDADLEFLEDVTDTLSDLINKSEGQEDWKTKYEENDKQWREKYRDRFFEKKEELEEIKEEPKTFEDLFK
jgi:phosphoglycolate phosphatase-like HAD superfamily hydrolase